MTKEQLRQFYKGKRRALDSASYAAAVDSIMQQLQQRDWSGATYVHIYLPIVKMSEIDTWPFIAWLQEYFPKVNIVVSRSNPNDFTMQHYRFVDRTFLVENKWGILEPIEGDLIDVKLLDVVLIPLLVADKDGNRVGYGKGFYDRFLEGCRSDCLKLGLSLFEPVDQIDDLHAQDIPLDKLITPKGTYSFNR